MSYSTFFIDLDETVYSTSSGVWDAISTQMEQFMYERLNLPREEIPAIRTSLYQAYGTTLRGLQVTWQVDQRDFLDFVHDVPLDQLLQPDPELHRVLMRYQQRKLIFTNADRNHANRVLRQIQLTSCFDGMIDILDLSPYCKPMPESFEIALRLAGSERAENCVFIDDSPRNLAAARKLGFFTIQVGEPKAGIQQPLSGAHRCISRLSELPTVLDPISSKPAGEL